MSKGWIVGLFVVILLAHAIGVRAEQCRETPDDVIVTYHITAVGQPPNIVSINIPTARLASGAMVVNGIAIWHVQGALYNKLLAGKSLDTILQDAHTGTAVTREVRYQSDLRECDFFSFPKGDQK